MQTLHRWSILGMVVALTLAGQVRAAGPAQTTITVPDIHCKGCAKRVAEKLQQVPGVASVQADAQAKVVTIVPKGEVVLSPRALWEAVERANKHPTRLEGPSGTFSSKPQS